MKIFTVALVVVLLGMVAARKGKWKHKEHLKNELMKAPEVKDSNMIGNPTEYGAKSNTKTFKLNHYFGKKVFKKNKYGGKKFKKAKKAKKMHKAMAWLNLQPDVDCEMKCKEGEVCISGPVVTEPICVHKKDLKKSMKLFHKFHKKETKTWRKFQKKHYKKDWKLHEKKYGQKNKYNADTMKEKKLKKLQKAEHNKMDMHFPKNKPHHAMHQKLTKPITDCSEVNMVSMRNRLMGWFHLLHGQDHEARKAHGGSISKFYKHVSVKKELQELNGEQCQCFKSAVWQFHKLDKSKDNHLTFEELTYLQENSVEPCMKPYLQSCDRDGDSKISNEEWCCCFSHVLPPCFKEMSEIKKAGKPVTYLPRCDKEGYYMLEQCRGDKADDSYECWCVDYNGNEYKDTSKKGRAHCHQIEKLGYNQKVLQV